MSHLNRLKQLLSTLADKRHLLFDYWKKTPTTKIIVINTTVYLMWKLKLIPEQFMVKHFSAERYNLGEGRLHTLVTYAFSHTSFFGYALDTLMLGFLGKAIQMNLGNKYIYWLFGLGALFGGLSSTAFQTPSAYIKPEIGAESVTGAMWAFLGLLNPRQTFYLFFIPVQAWILLFCLGTYSLLYDPHKKIFAGMTAGLTVYQMMRVRFL